MPGFNIALNCKSYGKTIDVAKELILCWNQTNNPPEEMGGIKIRKKKNFGNEGYKDEDGELIPLENFHILELENNFTYAVRASGTEPKIKFYVFGNETVSDQRELSNI